MSVIMKSKVSYTDVSKKVESAAAVGNMKEGEKRVPLGRFIGVVREIAQRTMPDGVTKYKALSGDFELTPYDEKKDTVRSGIAYLPAGIQETFITQMEAEDGPAAIGFAFEIGVMPASNAAGYSWYCEPLLEARVETDPLAALREAAAKPKALEAPKAQAKVHGKG